MLMLHRMLKHMHIRQTSYEPNPFLESRACSAADGTKSSLCFDKRKTCTFHRWWNFGPLLPPVAIYHKNYVQTRRLQRHRRLCMPAYVTPVTLTFKLLTWKFDAFSIGASVCSKTQDIVFTTLFGMHARTHARTDARTNPKHNASSYTTWVEA